MAARGPGISGPSTPNIRSLGGRAAVKNPELADEIERVNKSEGKAQRKLGRLDTKKPFDRGRRHLVATELAKVREMLKPGKGRVAHRWDRVRLLSPEYSKFNTIGLGSQISDLAMDEYSDIMEMGSHQTDDLSKAKRRGDKDLVKKEARRLKAIDRMYDKGVTQGGFQFKAEKEFLTTRNLRRLTKKELDALMYKGLSPSGIAKVVEEQIRRTVEFSDQAMSRRGVMGKAAEAMIKPNLPVGKVTSGAGEKAAKVFLRLLTRGRGI